MALLGELEPADSMRGTEKCGFGWLVVGFGLRGRTVVGGEGVGNLVVAGR